MINILSFIMSVPLFVMDIFDDLFNNPLRALLDPFYAVYGNWFTAVLFGLVGIIYYRHSENIAGITGYMLVVGAFCSVIFDPSITVLFAIITSAGIGAMLFKSFMVKHEEF